MRGTIDKAGRLVIPKPLRDQLGLSAGAVELLVEGTGLRVEPVADDRLVERRGRLVIAASDSPVTDEDVRMLRESDQA